MEHITHGRTHGAAEHKELMVVSVWPGHAGQIKPTDVLYAINNYTLEEHGITTRHGLAPFIQNAGRPLTITFERPQLHRPEDAAEPIEEQKSKSNALPSTGALKAHVKIRRASATPSPNAKNVQVVGISVKNANPREKESQNPTATAKPAASPPTPSPRRNSWALVDQNPEAVASAQTSDKPENTEAPPRNRVESTGRKPGRRLSMLRAAQDQEEQAGSKPAAVPEPTTANTAGVPQPKDTSGRERAPSAARKPGRRLSALMNAQSDGGASTTPAPEPAVVPALASEPQKPGPRLAALKAAESESKKITAQTPEPEPVQIQLPTSPMSPMSSDLGEHNPDPPAPPMSPPDPPAAEVEAEKTEAAASKQAQADEEQKEALRLEAEAKAEKEQKVEDEEEEEDDEPIGSLVPSGTNLFSKEERNDAEGKEQKDGGFFTNPHEQSNQSNGDPQPIDLPSPSSNPKDQAPVTAAPKPTTSAPAITVCAVRLTVFDLNLPCDTATMVSESKLSPGDSNGRWRLETGEGCAAGIFKNFFPRDCLEKDITHTTETSSKGEFR